MVESLVIDRIIEILNSLFGDISDDTLNDLVIAVNNKNRVKSAAKKAIRRAFSKEEIRSVFFELSNI